MADANAVPPMAHDAQTTEVFPEQLAVPFSSNMPDIEARVRRKLDVHVLSLLSFLCKWMANQQ
jgi:hypothetical protein